MGILESLDEAISIMDKLNSDAKKNIAKITAEKEKDFFFCCICRKKIWGNELHGNNPEPLEYADDAQCCDDCNDKHVIPERMKNFFG